MTDHRLLSGAAAAWRSSRGRRGSHSTCRSSQRPNSVIASGPRALSLVGQISKSSGIERVWWALEPRRECGLGPTSSGRKSLGAARRPTSAARARLAEVGAEQLLAALLLVSHTPRGNHVPPSQPDSSCICPVPLKVHLDVIPVAEAPKSVSARTVHSLYATALGSAGPWRDEAGSSRSADTLGTEFTGTQPGPGRPEGAGRREEGTRHRGRVGLWAGPARGSCRGAWRSVSGDGDASPPASCHVLRGLGPPRGTASLSCRSSSVRAACTRSPRRACSRGCSSW